MCAQTKTNEIPIFFATDDNYAPFLSVTLNSMLKNASKEYFYKIFVLTTNLNPEYEKRIKLEITDNASIEFISLKNELDKVQKMFYLRDYYSKETYYRFFIANLFPQYDKVLYLDCDIIILGDISELYNTDISNYLVGAAPEEVMNVVEVFGNYVEKTLDIDRQKYFNAGILLINAERFRKEKIEEQFVDLLNRFKFSVTQDQDYLNVLCKNQVKFFELGWNKTSFKNVGFNDNDLKIIHYKIHYKPWHYTGVEYENHFWDYAKKTDFYNDLINKRNTYSEDQKKQDAVAYERLMEQAAKDSVNPNNYRNSMNKGHRSVYGSRNI
jgi:lipopolysaccharide biosynthesis glycosyltransferase